MPLLVGLALLLAGCDRSPAGPQAGDCFEDPPRQVDTLPTVACEDGRFELVAVAALDEEGAYPGLAELSTLAFDRCLLAAEEYTGRDIVTSELDVWFHHPSEQAWGAGDRRFVCAVTRVDGQALGGSTAG